MQRGTLVGPVVVRLPGTVESADAECCDPFGVAVADAATDDQPPSAVSGSFVEHTGHVRNGIGRDCRALRDPKPDTSGESVARARPVVDDERPAMATLRHTHGIGPWLVVRATAVRGGSTDLPSNPRGSVRAGRVPVGAEAMGRVPGPKGVAA
jgi:hypothetical protein